MRHRSFLRSGWSLLAILLLALTSAPFAFAAVKEGDAAPDIKVSTYEGASVSLSDYSG